MQEVVIADPDFPEQEAFELVDRCHERGVAVRIAPTTMEIMTHRHELVPGQSVPLFELKPPVFEGLDFVLKRSFDVVVASASLVVLSPLLLAIALAIKLTSRGPVLFRSRRPGIGGQPFDCLKFRTMHTDAEQRQEELEGLNEASGALFKIRQRPAPHARRRHPAPLQPRRAAAARERAARRHVDGRPAAAADARLRAASRTGTASATWCCPASPACGRCRAGPSWTSTSWCASTSSTWSAGASSSISRSC